MGVRHRLAIQHGGTSPTVCFPPLPFVWLEAFPSLITFPETTLLKWRSINSTAVLWSNFGATSIFGQSIQTPTVTTTYGIRVIGIRGQAYAAVTVTVIHLPVYHQRQSLFTLAKQLPIHGTRAWLNPTRALVLDGLYAQVLLQNIPKSQTLIVYGDAWTPPPGAVLDGFYVQNYRRRLDNNHPYPSDFSIGLYLGDVLHSDEKVCPGFWSYNWEAAFVGDQFDDWNTDLTMTQISSADFGLGICVQKESTGGFSNYALLDIENVFVCYHT